MEIIRDDGDNVTIKATPLSSKSPTIVDYKIHKEGKKHGSDHEDANEHIEKVLEIVDLFHLPNITIDQVILRAFSMSLTRAEVVLFYNGLDVLTRQILDSRGAIPSKTAIDAKVAIQEMDEYSRKWHNGT
nr:hypothetical protein [Tanacetum cinerariifolium]